MAASTSHWSSSAKGTGAAAFAGAAVAATSLFIARRELSPVAVHTSTKAPYIHDQSHAESVTPKNGSTRTG